MNRGRAGVKIGTLGDLHTPASLAAEDALDECCRAREAARKADAKAADAKLAALRAKVAVPKGAAGLA